MSSEKPLDNSESNVPKGNSDTPNLAEEFVQKITQLELSDEKIRFCLDQMRVALSQEKSPRFKEFWEMRRYCLPLFKENIPSFVRGSLWKEFVEITAEARRLKDILDEQASFTIEQIDLAITGLENEISKFETLIEKYPKLELSQNSKILSHDIQDLADLQSEINVLSTLIQRMNALRKELIATEIRVRFKNKFFKRINSIGDFLFPKRKELINQLSSIFLNAVQKFYDHNFSNDVVKSQFYSLKDEIKSVQAISKELTLSNKAFLESRNLLSLCWDKIKGLENLRKQEFKERKEVFEENKVIVLEKIEELNKKLEGYTYDQLDEEIKEIFKFMRSLELGREEVKELKEILRNIKSPFEEKRKKEEELRLQKEKELLEEKRKKLLELRSDISKAQETLNDPDSINDVISNTEKKASQLNLTKSERQILERELKPLKDLYADLKEKILLASLSDDELKSLEKMKNVLEERRIRRKTIKDQLEVYRKELGGSGFDFEKAMMLRDLIDAEKLRLEKAEEGINEIEEKISEIEGR